MAPLLRRLAPLLVLVALIASACGSATEHPTATVNGKQISVSAVRDELKTIQANSAYRQALETSYGAKLAGAGKGTFTTAFVAEFLSVTVYYELLTQALAARDAKVTAADDAAGATSVEQSLASLGPAGTKDFPASYLARLGHQQALVAVSQRVSLAAYTETAQVACVKHILVATQSRSAAAAEKRATALKAQLDAGAAFATVAKASSDDTGSAAKGGDLGCNLNGVFDPTFEATALSQPVGQVSKPVKTRFGYHLILTTSRRRATASDLTDAVRDQAFRAYLGSVVCGKKTSVKVDPSYGTWDTSPCKDQQGLAKVKPPKQPAISP